MENRSTITEWPLINILTYHDIYERPREPKYDHLYVTEKQFKLQITGLLRAGYNPVSFHTLLSAIDDACALPKNPFVVTFDDGYRSVLESAHSFLMERHVPYTVFLVSGRIGGVNDWVTEEGFDTSPLMSWSEIVEISKWEGVSLQAHTVSHPHLADISPERTKEELRVCKNELEQHLQRSVDVICYPYGSVDEAVVDYARDVGYAAGVTTQFGRVRQSDDVMRLPRVSMHYVPPFSLKFGPRWPNFWWRIKSRKDTRP